MKYDDYGQVYCSTSELCELIYKNPNLDLHNFQVEDPETYNKSIKFFYLDLPKLKKYDFSKFKDQSIEDFDYANQQNWHMPESYKQLDIAEYVVNRCKTDNELERVSQELILYQERNLFDLLRFLKYLVDIMREHNIVWGVGRGSSVSSYVLYLLGIHKIDSIKYQLDIKEFLK
jgi:DNA polymerase III alpha subunit